jgi:hypothetical protein
MNPGTGALGTGTNTIAVQGSGFGNNPSLSLAGTNWSFGGFSLQSGSTDAAATWQFSASTSGLGASSVDLTVTLTNSETSESGTLDVVVSIQDNTGGPSAPTLPPAALELEEPQPKPKAKKPQAKPKAKKPQAKPKAKTKKQAAGAKAQKPAAKSPKAKKTAKKAASAKASAKKTKPKSKPKAKSKTGAKSTKMAKPKSTKKAKAKSTKKAKAKSTKKSKKKAARARR